MPSAEIIAIGSELLLGQIVDTNSNWIAQRLKNLGIDLFYGTVVGDNPVRLQDTLVRALNRSDVIITSGGLGPTEDDITREIIAEVTGRKLILVPKLLNDIKLMFRERGLAMTRNNEKQAYIPRGSKPVHNPNGTAPSFIVENNKKVILSLPGVPFEMKWLFEHKFSPYLQNRFNLSEVITFKVLKVADMGESTIDDLIGYLITSSTNPTVGVLAHPGQVDIRITAKANTNEKASSLISHVEKEIRRLLGAHIFAVDDESIEDSVGKLLREKNVTISSYENLTGGMVAQRLHQASPEHFIEGIIGTSTASIQRLLGHAGKHKFEYEQSRNGEYLAERIASGIQKYTNSDFGLAVHGITDPKNTSENLALGQTFISITGKNFCKSRTYNITGKGQPDRVRMSLNAIELVRRLLKE